MSKTYIIGDLHGCFDEFIALSNRIGIKENDLVISLGDIVDRGNKSVDLYKYFRERENSVVLMGNHERKHLKGTLSYSQEIVKIQMAKEYDDFLKWLKTLPYYFETEEALIIHAFFEHDIPLHHQKKEVLAGTTSGSRFLEKKYKNGTYWNDYYTGNKPIIYGHHVVGEKPKIKNNTYGIDTGACHGGYLTIVELPGFKIHQIKVEKDHWKEEQAKWQIPVLYSKDWENMKIEQIHKQIKNLGYKKEPDIISFLDDLNSWIHQISDTILALKDKIEEIAKELKAKYQSDFYKEVAQLSYSGFIYKANAGHLQLNDVQKHLDTPQKVIDLALKLELDNVPFRKVQNGNRE